MIKPFRVTSNSGDLIYCETDSLRRACLEALSKNASVHVMDVRKEIVVFDLNREAINFFAGNDYRW